MRYELTVRDNVYEVRLSEKITFSDLEDFRDMIDRLMKNGAPENILDFSGVDFIDSAGLGMLLLARDEISNTPSRLVLRAPQGQVRRMFDVARFDRMFHIDGL